jgi:hypothetical protein
VSTPPAGGQTFDSIIGDLSFPEPYEPEPYEPYDPMNPKPSTPADELPQRVPGAPDVPEVQLEPNDPLRDPATAPVAESGELNRIATFLRTDSADGVSRQDGFDIDAVLQAVRSVRDVRDAQLRWDEKTGHRLRIEFVDGVDEGLVTREVARLLRETMGVESAPAEQTRAGGSASGRASVPGAAPPPGLDHQSGRPLPAPGGATPRVIVDHVQVATLGLDATVDVKLTVSHGGRVVRTAAGKGHGPAVDAYLLRLAASAAGNAIDQLLTDQAGVAHARCFVEHVAVVPFAGCEVAVVVMLLVRGQVAEQLSGSAVVSGDPRQAVVRATLSAVNRRLESLLG